MKAAPSGGSRVAGALTLRGPRPRPAAKGLLELRLADPVWAGAGVWLLLP